MGDFTNTQISEPQNRINIDEGVTLFSDNESINDSDSPFANEYEKESDNFVAEKIHSPVTPVARESLQNENPRAESMSFNMNKSRNGKSRICLVDFFDYLIAHLFIPAVKELRQ